MTIFSLSFPKEAGKCTQEENREIKYRQCSVNHLKSCGGRSVSNYCLSFSFFCCKGFFLLLVLSHFLCELFKTICFPVPEIRMDFTACALL